jgi:hypothetical protein
MLANRSFDSSAVSPPCAPKVGGGSKLSKARYAAFEDELRSGVMRWRGSVVSDDEAVAAVLSMLCEVTKYDPSRSTYTPAQAHAIKSWRQRQKRNLLKDRTCIGSYTPDEHSEANGDPPRLVVPSAIVVEEYSSGRKLRANANEILQ